MYFCIMSDKNIKPGEVAVLKRNNHGDICCYLIDGSYVGYVCAKQPDGCLDFWDIASGIGSNRVLCTVTIKANRLLIMSTDSKVFDNRRMNRVEYEGYGMMISA